MYKSFRVQNFRGFKDLRLDDLARVNLIAGKNNTGKTALLEAILTYTGEYDARRLLRSTALPYSYRSADFVETHDGEAEDSDWELLFHNLDTNIPIRMEATTYNPEMLPGLREDENYLEISVVDVDVLSEESRLFRRAFREGSDISPKVLEFQSGTEEPVHLAWERRAFRGVREPSMHFPAIFIPSSRMMPRSQDTRRFSDLYVARKIGGLLKVLREFEPRLTELALVGEPASIHGDLTGLGRLLPVSSMGEGLRRITSLLLAISTTENGIILIDEIENGLHHSVQSSVWNAIAEAARAYNVQIFATTHSLEMIQAAHKAFFDDEPYDFRLHRLHRSTKTDEITPTTYNKFSMSSAIELEAEVR